ncbi:MAG: hypothetical protein AAF533_09560, partial [Acidobacteriota bacterium]
APAAHLRPALPAPPPPPPPPGVSLAAAPLAPHDRLVIPWGAYHLKDIEAELLADGFAQVAETQHVLVPFRLVFGR